MEDIQAIINKKAERIVNDKITEIISLFFDKAHVLINTSSITLNVNDKVISLRDGFFTSRSEVFKVVKPIMLEQEIETQSKIFVEKIEELSNDLNDLIEQQ